MPSKRPVSAPRYPASGPGDVDGVGSSESDVQAPRPTRCTYLTVPDESVRGWDRLVRCDRLPSEHPVRAEGRYVNHEYCLGPDGQRVTG